MKKIAVTFTCKCIAIKPSIPRVAEGNFLPEKKSVGPNSVVSIQNSGGVLSDVITIEPN